MKRTAGIIARLTIGLFMGAFNLSAPAVAASADDVAVLSDVVYGHKFGMALTFDVYRPSNANGAAVIFANSGGFVSGQLGQCEPEGLSGCGYLGADKLYVGDDKTPLAMLHQFSFEYLLDAAFPFLVEALPSLQLDAEALDSLSIKHRIGAHNPPTLIIYGDSDMPFITGPSTRIHKALRDAGVPSRLIVFAGTGHEFSNAETGYDRHYGEQAQEALVTWFTTHLRAE